MKTNTYIFAGLLAVIVLLATCSTCQNQKIKRLEKDCGKEIVTVKHDTVRIKEALDVPVYVPQPYAVEKQVIKEVRIPVMGETVYRAVDTLAILAEFNSYKYYSDPLQTKYGTLTVSDTVHQNRITGRSWKADFNIPIVKETITVTEKKRNELYFGLNAMGSKDNYLEAGGVSLMLRNKHRRCIEIGAYSNLSGNLTFTGGIKFPLSLKNH